MHCVPSHAEDHEDLDEDDAAEWGAWQLRANSLIAAAAVAVLLPEPLQHLGSATTEQAVDLFESVEAEEPRSPRASLG